MFAKSGLDSELQCKDINKNFFANSKVRFTIMVNNVAKPS